MRRRILLTLGALLLAGASLTCSPVYVLRAGYEEAKILSRRRPIPEVVADPLVAAEERRKLELVLQARTFADRGLGLDVGGSYTTYSHVDRDTLLLVVSASEQDRFRYYQWWFPIVGRVPYKGFFRFEHAFEEARRLERAGYDSHVRPAAAFSTLGWFNDPMLSTLLRAHDVSLAGTVIHELTHNTIYLPGQAAFNESFANFVGERGAIEYFCGVEGEEGTRCRQALDSWHDNLLFGSFLSSVIADLEGIYQREELSREDKIRLREPVFESARDRFAEEVGPRLRFLGFGAFATGPLNNATLIARRLYYDRLDRFEAAHEALGGRLRETIDAIAAAARARSDDPYGALEELIDRPYIHRSPRPESD